MWGIKLKKLIKKANLSQREVAAGTNTPESSVSVWINQVYPPLDFIEKCCEFMEIPLWQFFAPEELVIPELVGAEAEFMKALKSLPDEIQTIIVQQAQSTVKAYKVGLDE